MPKDVGAAQPEAASSALCARQHVSLGGIPSAQRLEAWRATFGGAHAITTEKPGEFSAELSTVAVGPMLVHRMTATAQGTERTPAMIRRDGMDHILLYLCSSAMQAGTQTGDFAIPGGTISVNDLSRPYVRSAAPERGSVILSLSRDLVAEALPDTDGLHGLVLRQGAGALMVAHMQALAEGAGHVTRDGADAAARATVELFAACILSTPDAVARAREPIQAAILVRAKRFIEQRLAEPGLSPDRVGEAINVSRATLFRLFAPLGGVARYIQDRRLSLVRRELIGGARHKTIAEIGYRFGFGSDVHLSRAFRRKYGVSPTELRAVRQPPDAAGPDEGHRIIANWLSQYS